MLSWVKHEQSLIISDWICDFEKLEHLPVANITRPIFMNRTPCSTSYSIHILVTLGRVLSKIDSWKNKIVLFIISLALTLRLLIVTKYCPLWCLLVHSKCLCSKQCWPRSDYSLRSSLIWVNTFCLFAVISPWHKHLHAEDTFLDTFSVAGEGLNKMLFWQKRSNI